MVSVRNDSTIRVNKMVYSVPCRLIGLKLLARIGENEIVLLAGAREVAGTQCLEQAGRSRAIRVALQQAGPDDVVLVLGKGHEKGQIVGDQVNRFDDVEQVRTIWNALRLVGGQEDDDEDH